MHVKPKRTNKKWADLLYASSYTPVMAAGIESVSLYLHGLLSVSVVVLCISVVFLLVIISRSLINIVGRGNLKFIDPRNGEFNNFTFIAGTSSVLLWIEIFFNGYFFTILSSIMLFFTVLYTILFLFIVFTKHPIIKPAVSTLWLISGIPLLSTSILVLNSVHPYHVLLRIDILFIIVAYVLAVCFYILVLFLNMLRWMRHGVEIERTSGATWINVGFGGLISICSYYLMSYYKMPMAFHSIIYGIMLASFSVATLILPFVIFLSLSKIRSAHTIKYAPSLWPSVFSISVYSISSLMISRVFAIDAIYYYSLAFEFLSLILLVTYIILLIRSGMIYSSENLASDKT